MFATCFETGVHLQEDGCTYRCGIICKKNLKIFLTSSHSRYLRFASKEIAFSTQSKSTILRQDRHKTNTITVARNHCWKILYFTVYGVLKVLEQRKRRFDTCVMGETYLDENRALLGHYSAISGILTR